MSGWRLHATGLFLTPYTGARPLPFSFRLRASKPRGTTPQKEVGLFLILVNFLLNVAHENHVRPAVHGNSRLHKARPLITSGYTRDASFLSDSVMRKNTHVNRIQDQVLPWDHFGMCVWIVKGRSLSLSQPTSLFQTIVHAICIIACSSRKRATAEKHVHPMLP